MSKLFDLTGKVAIVTGGNKGLGAGIALALAEAGADIAADLTSIAPIDRIVSTTLSELGGLDILVNNAGMIRRADSVDFTEADWDAVIDLNLKSAFFLVQAAGRHMIRQGSGKIINIASMLSFQGGIRVPSYTASKSASPCPSTVVGWRAKRRQPAPNSWNPVARA